MKTNKTLRIGWLDIGKRWYANAKIKMACGQISTIVVYGFDALPTPVQAMVCIRAQAKKLDISRHAEYMATR